MMMNHDDNPLVGAEIRDLDLIIQNLLGSSDVPSEHLFPGLTDIESYSQESLQSSQEPHAAPEQFVPPPLQQTQPAIPPNSFQPNVYRAVGDDTEMPIYQTKEDYYRFNSKKSIKMLTPDFYMRFESTETNNDRNFVLALISNMAYVIPVDPKTQPNRLVVYATISDCSLIEKSVRDKVSSPECETAFKVAAKSLTEEQKKLKRMAKSATPSTWCTLEWLASLTGSRKVRIRILDPDYRKSLNTFLWIPYDHKYVRIQPKFRTNSLKLQTPLQFPSPTELDWSGSSPRKITGNIKDFDNAIWKSIVQNRKLSDDPIENEKWTAMNNENMLFTPFSVDLSKNQFKLKDLIGTKASFDHFIKMNPVRNHPSLSGAANQHHWDAERTFNQDLKRIRVMEHFRQLKDTLNECFGSDEPFGKRPRYNENQIANSSSTMYSSTNVEIGGSGAFPNAMELYNPPGGFGMMYAPTSMTNAPKKPKKTKQVSNSNNCSPVQKTKTEEQSDVRTLAEFKHFLTKSNTKDPVKNDDGTLSYVPKRGRPTVTWSFIKRLVNPAYLPLTPNGKKKADIKPLDKEWTDYVHKYIQEEFDKMILMRKNKRGNLYRFSWTKFREYIQNYANIDYPKSLREYLETATNLRLNTIEDL